MSTFFSLQDSDLPAVSDAMRLVVKSAFENKGSGVQIPADLIKETCVVLSAKTADQLLTIRRHERAVSPKALAFSFS